MRSAQKIGFVYLWHDHGLKRFYLGSHWGSLDDGYICSSPAMRAEYKKRPSDFRRRILAIVAGGRDAMLKEEQRWIDMIKPDQLGGRYYNINKKVVGYLWWLSDTGRKSVGQKISVTKKGRPSGRKGTRHSEASRMKMSRAHSGTVPTAAHRSKTSATMRGRKPYEMTDAVRLKISEAKKGTPAWNKGIPGRGGADHHMFGRKHSAETREKIRATLVARRLLVAES